MINRLLIYFSLKPYKIRCDESYRVRKYYRNGKVVMIFNQKEYNGRKS